MISRNRIFHNKQLFIEQGFIVRIKVKSLLGIIRRKIKIGGRQKLRDHRLLLKYMKLLIFAKMIDKLKSKSFKRLLKPKKKY